MKKKRDKTSSSSKKTRKKRDKTSLPKKKKRKKNKKTYLNIIHGALIAKQIEVESFIDSSSSSETATENIWKLYNTRLTQSIGFVYNPHRAYFERDQYQTGILYFKNNISLLEGDSIDQITSRSARLDAFLCMFEQRQALTQWSNLNQPAILFIGTEIKKTSSETTTTNLVNSLPAHHYKRYCMATVLNDNITLCVTIIDHVIEYDLKTNAYTASLFFTTLFHLPSTLMFITNTNETIVKKEIMHRWRGIIEKQKSIFSSEAKSLFKNFRVTRHRVIKCADGDSQLIQRLGVSLEIPYINSDKTLATIYEKTNLKTLLSDVKLTTKTWMKTILVGRIFPYVFLAWKLNYIKKITVHLIQLTEDDRIKFNQSIVPSSSSSSSSLIVNPSKIGSQIFKNNKIKNADLLDFVEELYGYKTGELYHLFNKSAMAWKNNKGPSATTIVQQKNLLCLPHKKTPMRYAWKSSSSFINNGGGDTTTNIKNHHYLSMPYNPILYKLKYKKHLENTNESAAAAAAAADLVSKCLEYTLKKHPKISLYLSRQRLHVVNK